MLTSNWLWHLICGVFKSIGIQIPLDRKPCVRAVFVIEFLLFSVDDGRVLDRFFALDLSWNEGALAKHASNRVVPRFIGDFLRYQRSVALELHVHIEVYPLVAYFRAHNGSPHIL